MNYKILISIIIIIVIILVTLKTYKDSFIDVSQINYFDTNIPQNYKLLDNDFINILGDGYNKIVLADEDKIKKIYDDTIIKSNIVNDLMKNYKKVNKKIPKTFPVNKSIKTIKSKNNSQYLSVITNDVNEKYGILVNDKCLTVSGTCGTDQYCLQNCQNNLYASDSQKFYTTRINTSADASKILGSGVEINSKIVYPFNIFRSKVDDTCLALSNDGVTLEKCNLNDIRHQWSISPDENLCVLN